MNRSHTDTLHTAGLLRALAAGGAALLLATAAASAQRTIRSEQIVLDDNQNPPSTITIRPPTGPFTSWTMTLPDAPPSGQSILTSDNTGKLLWVATVPAPGGWALTGNSGTTAGTNFLGTSDSIAFQIHVNNTAATLLPNEGNGRAMRFEPNNLSPNIIGGYKGNSVTAGSRGVVIGGGGANTQVNSVTSATADFATIGGGLNNTISSTGAGANGLAATIIGGGGNTVSGDSATAMGHGNTVAGTVATAFGSSNIASGRAAFTAGERNTASGAGAVALGNHVTATSAAAVAIGEYADATAAGSIVIGRGHTGSHLTGTANSLAVGFNTSGTTTPTLYVGPNSGNADNRGNVGVGTSTPASRLTVRGENNAATNSALNVTNNSGTSALFITNDRRVGLGGVIDPEVSGTDNVRFQIGGLTNGVFSLTNPISYAMVVNNAAGNPLLRIRDDGRMQLRTADASFSGITTHGSMGPALDNTYDLGSCALQWRDVYIGRNLIFNAVCSPSVNNKAEISYGAANTFLDFRVSNGTAAAPATAMVIDENNRRVGLTDGTGTAFTATAPQGALDIRSTTGALIVPRMTYAQRTAGTFPTVNGSLVYQTDNGPGALTEGFYAYEVNAWVKK